MFYLSFELLGGIELKPLNLKATLDIFDVPNPWKHLTSHICDHSSLGLLVIFHLIFILRRYGFVLSQGVINSSTKKILQNSFKFFQNSFKFRKNYLTTQFASYNILSKIHKIFLSRRVFNKKVQIFPVDIAIKRSR